MVLIIVPAAANDQDARDTGTAEAKLLFNDLIAVLFPIDHSASGSPGMDTGGKAEKYEVLIFNKDGTSKVYNVH